MSAHKPVLLIGDAYGEEEELQDKPFVGPPGKLLRSLLKAAGLSDRDVYFTNTVNQRPRPNNDYSSLCGGKKEGVPGIPAVLPGKYLRAEFADEIVRLRKEIETVNPNIIICAGAIPSTILTRSATKISRSRGTVFLHEGRKVLCTYHPTAILRDYSLRPILFKDLAKAAREAASPELTLPVRELWIRPTVNDLFDFRARHILPALDAVWGVDTETKGGTITEIGFSTKTIGIVVPFYSRAVEDGNYWRSIEEEVIAWRWTRQVLSELRQPVMQNGLYDLNYLWRTAGICVRYAGDDTMLLHHALQPELKKGLGFLASIYTNEAEWKFMRTQDTLKKEDE